MTLFAPVSDGCFFLSRHNEFRRPPEGRLYPPPPMKFSNELEFFDKTQNIMPPQNRTS